LKKEITLSKSIAKTCSSNRQNLFDIGIAIRNFILIHRLTFFTFLALGLSACGAGLASGPLNQAAAPNVSGSNNPSSDVFREVSGSDPNPATGPALPIPNPNPDPNDPTNSFPGSIDGSGQINVSQASGCNGPSAPSGQIGESCQPTGSPPDSECDVQIHLKLKPQDFEHDFTCPAKAPKESAEKLGEELEPCLEPVDGILHGSHSFIHSCPRPSEAEGPRATILISNSSYPKEVKISTHCNADEKLWEANFYGVSWNVPLDPTTYQRQAFEMKVILSELHQGQWVETGTYPLRIACKKNAKIDVDPTIHEQASESPLK